jgi:uncharacterized protein
MKPLLLLLIPLAVGVYFFWPKHNISPTASDAHYMIVAAGTENLILEVAETPEKWEQGLSNRKELAENEGMVFIFDKPDRYSFWMKDTLIPLDIIWLYQGDVTEIATLPATTSGQTPATHIPAKPADHVIEIPAGRAQALGIKQGTHLELAR